MTTFNDRREPTEEELRQVAYQGHYNRGWRAGARYSETSLDRADSRREPTAWYDGYYDMASDYAKWHAGACRESPCPQHR